MLNQYFHQIYRALKKTTRSRWNMSGGARDEEFSNMIHILKMPFDEIVYFNSARFILAFQKHFTYDWISFNIKFDKVMWIFQL